MQLVLLAYLKSAVNELAAKPRGYLKKKKRTIKLDFLPPSQCILLLSTIAFFSYVAG